jgi:hypothetical protein
VSHPRLDLPVEAQRLLLGDRGHEANRSRVRGVIGIDERVSDGLQRKRVPSAQQKAASGRVDVARRSASQLPAPGLGGAQQVIHAQARPTVGIKSLGGDLPTEPRDETGHQPRMIGVVGHSHRLLKRTAVIN